MIINHEKVKFLFSFFFVDCTEQHSTRFNSHHLSWRQVCNCDQCLSNKFFRLVECMNSAEDCTVLACSIIQCELKELLMEAVSFEDYINRLKAQNIIIETGNSKKYGTVTKYRFSVEQRFHRGYSLGSFYTDDNIKKRISRR